MRRVAALLAFAVAACGIDAVGTLDATGGPPRSAAPSDVADSGAPPPICAGTCAPPAVAAPFATVLFGARTAACPAGFDGADVVEDPVPGAGSCACGACTFSGTTCSTGALVSKYSSDTTCTGTGDDLQGNGGSCTTISGTWISTYAAILPPAAVVGTCSAPGVAVPANVTSKAGRICTPRSDACLDALCAPPATLAACVAADGDVACPSDRPARHLVGADLILACAACTCTTQATCSGTASFYTSSNRSGTARTLQAAVCTQVNQTSFNSAKWTGTIASQTCTNVTPAASATATLGGVRTVCCP